MYGEGVLTETRQANAKPAPRADTDVDVHIDPNSQSPSGLAAGAPEVSAQAPPRPDECLPRPGPRCLSALCPLRFEWREICERSLKLPSLFSSKLTLR